MPTKKTKAGQQYQVSGKTFTWTTEDGAEITIPLRVKLKVVRSMADDDLNSVTTMFKILEQIAPGQADALDEMDLAVDFQPMFLAWQAEYEKLSGASLGKSSGSLT